MPICGVCNTRGTHSNPLFVIHPAVEGKAGCAFCLGVCPNCGGKATELVDIFDEDRIPTERACASCVEEVIASGVDCEYCGDKATQVVFGDYACNRCAHVAKQVIAKS